MRFSDFYWIPRTITRITWQIAKICPRNAVLIFAKIRKKAENTGSDVNKIQLHKLWRTQGMCLFWNAINERKISRKYSLWIENWHARHIRVNITCQLETHAARNNILSISKSLYNCSCVQSDLSAPIAQYVLRYTFRCDNH
mgnify:CR=1 FL=1